MTVIFYNHEINSIQPLSIAREVNSAKCKERPRVQYSQYKLGNSMLQVQQTQKQQQSSVPSAATSSNLQLMDNETTRVMTSNESQIESTIPGILDNANPEEKVSIFNTSSDTVNELLRGLSSTSEADSIKNLSEETASVLPSFAKVLGQSSQPLTDGPCFHQLKDNNSDASGTHSEIDYNYCYF